MGNRSVVSAAFLFLNAGLAHAIDDKGIKLGEFNDYVVAGAERLLKDRALLGYEQDSFYTQDLTYGPDKILRGGMNEHTMCNAAVVETLVEGIRLYATGHPEFEPRSIIPTSYWNDRGWTALRYHLFGLNYLDMKPFKGKADEYPKDLKEKFERFDSKDDLPEALTKFGLAKRVALGALKPGDVVTFSRSRVTQLLFDSGKRKGECCKPKGSGHSVVFLGYLTREQKRVDTYSGDVAGFMYFSSQGDPGKGNGGLGVRWGYFEGFCPALPEAKSSLLPTDKAEGYCVDALATTAEKKKWPAVLGDQPRDCCITKTGPYGIRAGRVLSPNLWTFKEASAAVQNEHKALLQELADYQLHLEREKERARLLIEATKRQLQSGESGARKFADKVEGTLKVNLEAPGPAPDLQGLTAGAIGTLAGSAPPVVRDAANASVTPAVREQIDKDVDTAVEAVVNQPLPATDPANPRLDGKSVD